ncbi:MAG: helix-turn-helix transcriptional regulator [Pseudonocardia sp.]|nr:helix-turn-helix transcriptional regulator [Pseudonocardia sp.]
MAAHDPSSELVSPSIGDRIRDLRRGQRATQRDLAERAGISTEFIGQLERGVKQTASIPTLLRIASALDVDLAALVGRAPRISDVPAGPDGDAGGVEAIRRALLAAPEQTGSTAPDLLTDVDPALRTAWSAYWRTDYPRLAQMLPDLLGSARLLDSEQGTNETAAALSDALGVAASLLVHLGHVDLAQLAMERAVAAAGRADDELRSASLTGWMSWLLLHQVGLLDESQRLAERQADAIEPRMGTATPAQLSVWGSLLVSAAVAAGRRERPDESDGLLSLAEAAAVRLDGLGQPERRDYERAFGVDLIVMQRVEVDVVSDRPDKALERAERIGGRPLRLPAAARARHASDKAFAYVQVGRLPEATETLLGIERDTPDYMAYQQYPRAIIREIVERSPRTPGVRGLARRTGVLT